MTIDGELFLPRGYSENLPEPVHVANELDFWARPEELSLRTARRYQDPVYRLAARLDAGKATVTLDVGCGTGDGLVSHLAKDGARTVGVDQPSAIAVARSRHPAHEWIAGDLRDERVWDSLAELRPGLVVCADVIEHVDDPIVLLDRLRSLLGYDDTLVLSTPDRDRLEYQPRLGPPQNPHHIREWAYAEMRQLVESVGFTVRSSRHLLPRKFALTTLELKMAAWRALHLKAVPARRTCMVFELARA